MSNRGLPPEIRDRVVDFLHCDTQALSRCCLASKSWIPRTRKHLFAVARFDTPNDIDTWKKKFSDPSNSPAHYTRTLRIRCFEVITVADAAEGGWISAFSHVETLVLNNGLMSLTVPFKASFTLFCKFSPTLKSLRVTTFLLSLPRVFSLIRSLPLLEDLALSGTDTVIDDNEGDGPQVVVSPAGSRKLTGTLDVFMFEGMTATLRRLLDLPNGVHFRGISLLWCMDVEDFRYLAELVMACSDTLEDLFVLGKLEAKSTAKGINLSTATKLKNIEFRCESYDCKRLIMTIETITPQHQDLQQILIHIPPSLSIVTVEYREVVEEEIEGVGPGARWSDLDRVLVKLWESQATHIKVMYPRAAERNMARKIKDWAMYLLPELTGRGIADLVQEPD